MKSEEHKNRHIELHKALDELFADFIKCHPDLMRFTELPISVLLAWSYQQTKNPDEAPEEHSPEAVFGE